WKSMKTRNPLTIAMVEGLTDVSSVRAELRSCRHLSFKVLEPEELYLENGVGLMNHLDVKELPIEVNRRAQGICASGQRRRETPTVDKSEVSPDYQCLLLKQQQEAIKFGPALNKKQQRDLLGVLDRNQEAFSFDPYELGRCGLNPMTIDTEDHPA